MNAIPSIRTQRHARDTTTTIRLDPRTQKLMAAVTAWYIQRLKVKPSGSVTLRRAVCLYYLHLQNLQPADEASEVRSMRACAEGKH